MEIQLFLTSDATPIKELYMRLDAISVTANHDGFTTFNAVACTIGLDREIASQLAITAQDRNEVVVADWVQPKLIVVPKATEQTEIVRLTKELLQVANSLDVKKLLLTHFAFIPAKFPEGHVRAIVRELLATQEHSTIATAWFDVDPRHLLLMRRLLDERS